MRQWWSKIQRALGRRTLASELEQEMDAHLQFLVEKNLQGEMTPDEARTAAARVWQFGRRAGAKLRIVAVPAI
jgi:hypothetical protein